MKKLKWIYKIYRTSHDNELDSDHLIGRVMVESGVFHILEDRDGFISQNTHEGPVTEQQHDFLSKLAHSGYYKVIPEEEIEQGKHEELMPELDLGEIVPDHEYLLLNPDQEGPPSRVEIYENHWVLDGKNLNEEEKHDIMTGIREGRFQLFNL